MKFKWDPSFQFSLAQITKKKDGGIGWLDLEALPRPGWVALRENSMDCFLSLLQIKALKTSAIIFVENNLLNPRTCKPLKFSKKSAMFVGSCVCACLSCYCGSSFSCGGGGGGGGPLFFHLIFTHRCVSNASQRNSYIILHRSIHNQMHEQHQKQCQIPKFSQGALENI